MKKQFETDNRFGHYGEQCMIPFIEQYVKSDRYKLVFKQHSHDEYPTNKSKWKWYDLAFNIYKKSSKFPIEVDGVNKQIYFEIKTDRYPMKTDNLIFEFKSRGKKSGIYATKANFFIYFRPKYLTDNVWIIKTDNLKNLLKTKFKHCITSGGDIGSNTLMFKVPTIEFKELFIKSNGYVYNYNNYPTYVDEMGDRVDSFETEKYIRFYADEEKNYENPLDWLNNKK